MKQISIVKRELKLFLQATDKVDRGEIFKIDLVPTKEIFYMFFNLFNISIIQNYLKKISYI